MDDFYPSKYDYLVVAVTSQHGFVRGYSFHYRNKRDKPRAPRVHEADKLQNLWTRNDLLFPNLAHGSKSSPVEFDTASYIDYFLPPVEPITKTSTRNVPGTGANPDLKVPQPPAPAPASGSKQQKPTPLQPMIQMESLREQKALLDRERGLHSQCLADAKRLEEQIRLLQDQLRDFQAKDRSDAALIAQLQGDRSHLVRDSDARAQTQIQALQSQFQDADARGRSFQAQLQDSQARLNNLQGQLQDTDSRFKQCAADLAQVNSGFPQQFQQLQQQNAQLREQADALQQQIADAEQQNAQLQKQCQTSQQQTGVLQQLTKQNAQLRDQLAAQTSQLQTQPDAIKEQLQQQCAAQQGQLRQQNAQLQEIVRKQTADVQALQSQLQSQTQPNPQLQGQIVSLQKQLLAAQQQSQLLQTQIQPTQLAVAQQQQQNAQLQGQIVALQKQLQSTQTQTQPSQVAVIQQLQQQNAQLQGKLLSVQQQTQLLQTQIQPSQVVQVQQQQQNAQLQKQLLAAQQKIQALQAQLQALQAQLQNQNQNQQADEQQQQLQQQQQRQFAALQKQNAELLQRNEKLVTVASQHSSQNNATKQQLEAALVQIRLLESQQKDNAGLHAALSETQGQLQQLQNNNAALSREMAKLQSEREADRARFAQTLRAATQEIDKAREQAVNDAAEGDQKLQADLAQERKNSAALQAKIVQLSQNLAKWQAFANSETQLKEARTKDLSVLFEQNVDLKKQFTAQQAQQLKSNADLNAQLVVFRGQQAQIGSIQQTLNAEKNNLIAQNTALRQQVAQAQRETSELKQSNDADHATAQTYAAQNRQLRAERDQARLAMDQARAQLQQAQQQQPANLSTGLQEAVCQRALSRYHDIFAPHANDRADIKAARALLAQEYGRAEQSEEKGE
jgi:chromosome segregation ATPase